MWTFLVSFQVVTATVSRLVLCGFLKRSTVNLIAILLQHNLMNISVATCLWRLMLVFLSQQINQAPITIHPKP